VNRRAFLVGSLTALAAPLAAGAQPKPLVGFLSPFSSATGFTTTSVQAFREGLRELGWSPSENIRIEYRWADGRNERLESLAEELIQLHPAVIVANSGPAASAAKRATTTIPIVFETLGDPVAARLVPSLSRPGGNLTGVAGISGELSGKRLEVLREAVPGLKRIAMLTNPGNVAQRPIIEQTVTAAHALGMSLYSAELRGPGDLDRAVGGIARAGVGAVFVLPDVMVLGQRQRVLDLMGRHRLPAIYVESDWVRAGGLMSYAPDLRTQYRKAAVYVDRILKGAKPADLPVEQPTTFELLINLKTAKALGLTIPPSLLARADQVIE
jgi:putative tryptophan/tyrosine transport system substrate-binding protein